MPTLLLSYFIEISRLLRALFDINCVAFRNTLHDENGNGSGWGSGRVEERAKERKNTVGFWAEGAGYGIH